jgi:D-alanine-D-alanine ligase
MKKNIAIVAGGDSSEVVVSLKSADGIYSFIDKSTYNLYVVILKKGDWSVRLGDNQMVPVDKNDFSFVKDGVRTHFDFAYITIHGTPGENGLLQGYFDLIGMPYSCCGVLASSITFNKFVCNNYLKSFDVNVADSIRLFKGESMADDEIVKRLGLPVFVKPNDGGSSFGVTKVKEIGQLKEAIAKAFDEGQEVLIESFISGTEVTCGCYKVDGKEVVFPLTEVVTSNEFFDFDAKYNGQVDEITPARISAEMTEKIQHETLRIYDILGAKGIIRVDYIIQANGEAKLLDINTTPGMTVTSFIPQQVRAAGLDIKDVMSDIISNELNKVRK